MVTAEAGGGAGVRRAENLVENGVFGRYGRDIRVDELPSFSNTSHHIPFTFLCSICVSALSIVRPSFVRRSSGTACRLPKGGYDPEEASRHMAE